jgi:hypothetical protein
MNVLILIRTSACRTSRVHSNQYSPSGAARGYLAEGLWPVGEIKKKARKEYSYGVHVVYIRYAVEMATSISATRVCAGTILLPHA